MKQSFFVEGAPVPKGSTKSFLHRKTGRIVTMQDNREKQKVWTERIVWKAREKGVQLSGGACSLYVIFHMPEPKSFRNAKGNRKPSAPKWHTKKPDLDKLLRCVMDALTGIAWKDDSQVIRIVGRKGYAGEACGAYIEIEGS